MTNGCASSSLAPSTKQKQKKYIFIKNMKNLFIIAALVTLASCSNETTSTSTDTTTTDTTCVDSACCDSASMDSTLVK